MSLKVATKFILTTLGLFFFVFIQAQENPGLVVDKVVQNEEYTFIFKSYNDNDPYNWVVIPSNAEAFNIADLNGNDEYELRYTPALDYLGSEEIVVEYKNDGPSGQWPPGYITFNIEVVASILEADDDFHVFDGSNSSEAINVLDNDSTTGDTLIVSEIAQSSGGTASINSLGEIVFTPSDPSNFVGHVEYIVVDNEGTSDLGSLTIISDDQGGSDTLYFTVTNERAFNVILPGINCSISEYPSFGEAEIAPNTNALLYTPDLDAIGNDQVLVIDGSDELLVHFKVLDKPNANGFVNDDYIFTAWNNPVSFDVFANDYESSGNVIVDYSPELVLDSLGEFTYSPPQWYQGVQEFYYTAYNGFEHQEGKVIVSVDNQVPNSLGKYVISGLENEPIILNYNVPLEGYSFIELNAPNNGTLTIGSGEETVDLDCGELTGTDLIVYEPDEDYVGLDEFDLRYQIDGQNVSVVKFKVNIQEDNRDTLCHCVGPDCVWPGDTNNDGRVFIDDLLPIGLYMGVAGEERLDDISYSHWYGQTSEDWGTELGEIGSDLKHIDSDGDGYITSTDLDAVVDNFDTAHALFTNKILGSKDFGLFLQPSHMPVDSGDLLCLTINIGNKNNPVVDIHGLSFDLNINEDVIDSSSLTFEFFENDWFAYNSSQIDMHIQPSDGTIYAGLSRADGNVVSGYGPIGSTCFIVEDDLDGFKGDGQLASFKISTSQIVTMDSEGNYFQLPNTEIEIPYNVKEKVAISNEDVIVYPNPTNGNLNIHLNGPQNINDIQIIDFSGQLIRTYSNLDVDHKVLDVSNLTTGLYVAKIRSLDSWVFKKFKVLNQ